MVRVGILGMGFIGRTHAEAVRKVPGARLAAIASRRADAIGDEYADVERYDSYDDLVERAAVDAVVVALPTFLHERYAVAAAREGRHVLCEKPLALDAESAGRIVAAAREAGVTLMAGQVLRFWPQYVRIRELVAEGAVGEVRSVSAHRLASYPSWGEWFRDPEKSGGCRLDLQVHDVDFVHWLLGAPESVHTTAVRAESGADDHVVTTLRYPNAVAHVEASYLMPDGWPFTAGVRVAGTLGCLEYTFRVAGNIERRDEAVDRLLLHRAGGTSEEVAVPEEDAFVRMHRYFAECVAEGRPPEICPPEASLEVLRLLSNTPEGEHESR
jgi:predicted dehydrogenase